MKVSRRIDHTPRIFFLRTTSAQLHALGLVLLIAEAFVLLPLGLKAGSDHFAACLSYLVSGAFVFGVSSTYHFLHDGFEISSDLAEFLENLDHFVIYLFIAGTYSPFLLHTVSPSWQIPLLVGIWAIAILGITYTWLKPRLPTMLQHRILYTFLFVGMSGFLLVRVDEIFSHLSGSQLWLFFGGVVSYLIGACVYAKQWPTLYVSRFGYHELWHLLVLSGAQFHFFLILSFYAR